MTLEELYNIAQQFPMWQIEQDLDGQIIIYTGLMYEAPLGYAGSGPQNIPPLNRCDVDLRDMNEKDLPNVDS
jgi:hypothetical protein|tara:strand:- start:464 stop:679 length:216 start_codon:yes stop_codon:yes gene_type:complete